MAKGNKFKRCSTLDKYLSCNHYNSEIFNDLERSNSPEIDFDPKEYFDLLYQWVEFAELNKNSPMKIIDHFQSTGFNGYKGIFYEAHCLYLLAMKAGLFDSEEPKDIALTSIYKLLHPIYEDDISFWLEHDEFSNFLKKKNNNIPTPTKSVSVLATHLRKKLLPLEFFNLPLVSCLPDSKQFELLLKLAANKVPYQIAMFHHLGFIDLLATRNKNIKKEMIAVLTKLLDAPNRTIKGNVYILSPDSEEDSARYTSAKHITEVANDYKNLL